MKKGRYRYHLWLAASIALLFTALSMKAATITINSSADSGGTCPGATCTLRQALAAAASGDTINFAAGLATITLTSGELLINRAVTINGSGANLLTVQRSAAAGTPDFRIFHVVGNFSATISGLTIRAGNITANDVGGGIYNEGAILTALNCTIADNVVGFGGAGINNRADARSSTVQLFNCTVSNNTGKTSAGAIINLAANGGIANMTLVNCTVSGNTGGSIAGGIGSGTSSGGTLSLSIFNCTFSGNTPGTLSVGSGTEMGNTILKRGATGANIVGLLTSRGHNLSDDAAGGDASTGPGGTLNASGDQRNTDPLLAPLADNGGPTLTMNLKAGSPAIDAGDDSVLGPPLDLATDQRGHPRKSGAHVDVGAYEVNPPLSLVVTNTDDSGAGSVRDTIVLAASGDGITFAPNVGGAINLTSGELLINKGLTINGPGANLLTIQRSSAAGTPNFRIFHINGNFNVSISGLTIAKGFFPANLGGGISNDNGTLILDSVTVSGNTADIGAGIYTGRAATITNSTISGNTVSGNLAGDGGGAIYNQGGTLNLTNSTLAGNVAQTAGGGGQGGGIRNNLGAVSILSSTIAGNTADQGGGIYYSNGGSFTVQNSIIAQNTSANGPDLNGSFTSSGFNLIGNNSANSGFTNGTNNDQVGTPSAVLDPKLDSLKDNGGPTFTRALLPGSPAIDKGKTNNSANDQRGLPRPIDFSGIANAINGDGSDIGAFEVQPATTLANISTRLRVETGDNALIGGFIVTGTQPKKVILLAIGPSLPLADTLANPTLELYSGSTLLQSNNDWVNSPDKQAIIDSGVAPTNNLESAIIATLPANNSQYTAIVRGANNTTGIGVVQAYDLDRLADSKLANISTRGFVQTGNNVLIAGTIVLGQNAQRVIIRAIGPSLPFSGTLSDPTLELHDQNGGLIDSNDNWKDSPNKQAIIDSTIPPTNDLESAIVATLPANGAQYTAIVGGVNNSIGIAVVEVYALN